MPDPVGPRLVEVAGTTATNPIDRHAAVTTAFESYHAELYSFLRRATRDEEAAEGEMIMIGHFLNHYLTQLRRRGVFYFSVLKICKRQRNL
jgi:hypothetical protein